MKRVTGCQMILTFEDGTTAKCQDDPKLFEAVQYARIMALEMILLEDMLKEEPTIDFKAQCERLVEESTIAQNDEKARNSRWEAINVIEDVMINSNKYKENLNG